MTPFNPQSARSSRVWFITNTIRRCPKTEDEETILLVVWQDHLDHDYNDDDDDDQDENCEEVRELWDTKYYGMYGGGTHWR